MWSSLNKAGGSVVFVQPKSGFGLLFSGDLFWCLYNSGDLVQYNNDAWIILKLVNTIQFALTSRLPCS